MYIDIITAFPKMLNGPLQESMTKKAVDRAIVEIEIHNLRDWTKDKHQTIDDAPYGGGPGMIYKVEPLYNCLNDLFEQKNHQSRKIILMSPRGEVFSQNAAIKFSLIDHLIIICGHYKGVDERIKQFFPITEISIGDYVLSSGEVASLVMVDAVVRLMPGVLSDMDSAFTDSFNDYLLDCDYYTRPEVFKGVGIPKVLLTGDHKKIDAWRTKQKEEITKVNRPDLYSKYLNEIKSE
jgi:tRNA (guanine37-N1)-methyltransferase